MAACAMDLWRDRLGVGFSHTRRPPRQVTGGSVDERGRAAAYNPGEGGALPVALAGADPAFRAMVLQRRECGPECRLGFSDYVAARVFAGGSQAGSGDREPLCVDRAC